MATKDNVVDIDESGIFISFEPNSFIAFKNLKVENLDQSLNQTVDNRQLPTNGLESLTPCVMSLTLLAIAGVAITYLRKSKGKKAE